MKKSLLLFLSIFFLVACSSKDLDEEFKEKENTVQKLENQLHSEEVENKQLKSNLEDIEDEIAQVNRDKKDTNIDDYQTIISNYSNNLSRELNSLQDQLDAYNTEDELDISAIETIEENISNIIETYNDETKELKLQDTLSRQHSKIELFNDNLSTELHILVEALKNNNNDKIEESIENVKETTKFL